MSYDYFSPDGNASHKHSTHNHIQTEGSTVPIYHEGTLIKTVPVCWDWCNIQGTEYEISDVRYGSIDGVILPEICDIIEAIQEKMGLHSSLTFPAKFHHDSRL